MHRKWIILIALAALLVVTGCAKEEPQAAPPPVETEPPPPPPAPPPEPETVDEVEKKPEPTVAEMEENLRSQGLLGDVFFDFDKADLRPDARERLAKNAEFMLSEEGRGTRWKIEGHCDERGTNEYNLALGDRRAENAKDYLVSLGVDGQRLTTVSFGEERPFCTQSTEACWQQNRRAHFVLTSR